MLCAGTPQGSCSGRWKQGLIITIGKTSSLIHSQDGSITGGSQNQSNLLKAIDPLLKCPLPGSVPGWLSWNSFPVSAVEPLMLCHLPPLCQLTVPPLCLLAPDPLSRDGQLTSALPDRDQSQHGALECLPELEQGTRRTCGQQSVRTVAQCHWRQQWH